jgi:cytochrome c-type biogenesis protein CcmH
VTRTLLATLLGLAAVVVAAVVPVLAAEEVYDERTIEIGRTLACPVCQGQTVADSNSRVALEMMDAIEAQVQAGRSDEEIYDYFRARYGDEVLVEPPREGINLALWWIPVAALVLGLGVVGLYMKDSAALGRRRPQPVEQEADPELERLADRVLHEHDGEGTIGSGGAQVKST